MKRTVNLKHARTDFQREIMKRIAKDKVCPFCEAHFLKYHTRPIIKKGIHWTLTENFAPYEGSKHHLLAVSRKHVRNFAELSPAAHAELLALFAHESKKRGIKGGTVFMRFGDTDYTGGSVAHLHAQLISGVRRSVKSEFLTTGIAYKTTASPKVASKPARSRRPRP
jgi:diadenosine tetraphosphate (Ap4A) HIT family hydrolase